MSAVDVEMEARIKAQSAKCNYVLDVLNAYDEHSAEFLNVFTEHMPQPRADKRIVGAEQPYPSDEDAIRPYVRLYTAAADVTIPVKLSPSMPTTFIAAPLPTRDVRIRDFSNPYAFASTRVTRMEVRGYYWVPPPPTMVVPTMGNFEWTRVTMETVLRNMEDTDLMQEPITTAKGIRGEHHTSVCLVQNGIYVVRHIGPNSNRTLRADFVAVGTRAAFARTFGVHAPTFAAPSYAAQQNPPKKLGARQVLMNECIDFVTGAEVPWLESDLIAIVFEIKSHKGIVAGALNDGYFPIETHFDGWVKMSKAHVIVVEVEDGSARYGGRITQLLFSRVALLEFMEKGGVNYDVRVDALRFAEAHVGVYLQPSEKTTTVSLLTCIHLAVAFHFAGVGILRGMNTPDGI